MKTKIITILACLMLAGCAASHQDYLKIKNKFPKAAIAEWDSTFFIVRHPDGQVDYAWVSRHAVLERIIIPPFPK